MKKKPKIQKFPSGGHFFDQAGQLALNGLRSTIDVPLTTLGLSNVVPDSAYTGLGAEFGSNYSNKVGGALNKIAPMAANMLLPGAGTAISGAQNVAGQFNPQMNYDPNAPKQYAMGGVAELEKQEVFKMPNGQIDAVNGAPHSQGGVPVNIPNQTKILSDKLKLDGKTFAKLGAKYTTAKEDKVLSNDMATAESKLTAKLKSDIKQKKLDELFAVQEQMKQSKLNKYAEKLGIQLPQANSQFANQGMQKFGDGGYSNPTGSYDEFGNMIAGPNGEIMNKTQLTNNHNYTDSWNSDKPWGTKTPEQIDYQLMVENSYNKNVLNKNNSTSVQSNGTVPMLGYNPNSYNQSLKPFNPAVQNTPQQTFQPKYNHYQNSLKPWSLNKDKDNLHIDNMDLNTKEYSKPTVGDKSGINNSWVAPVVGGVIENIPSMIELAKGKKYDKVDYGKITPKLIDYSQSLKDARMQAAISRNQLKTAAGGNAGAVMANLGQLGAQNTANIANIVQSGENANADIINQANQANQEYKIKGMTDEAANKGAAFTNYNKAIASITSNPIKSYMDYKKGNMDMKTVGMLNQLSSKYGWNLNDKGDWELAVKALKSGNYDLTEKPENKFTGTYNQSVANSINTPFKLPAQSITRR